MGNFFTDNEDLQFYVDKWIDWAPLVELTEFFYRSQDGFANEAEALEFYRDIMNLVGEFVSTEIAPHTEEIDREAVRFEGGEAVFPDRLQGIFDGIKALELHGMCLPRELGGMNVPLMVYMLNSELFGRGDVSVMTHHGFHGGMAMAMLVFSFFEGTTTWDAANAKLETTRFAEEIGEIARGEAWGCMDITEPDAGSDMAALRTYAKQDDDGQWRITGPKSFITSGHGKYHFVIARTEDADDPNDPFAGLGGLSMFLAPAYEDDADGNRKRIVEITRLEEKLGHHGSATCALAFDGAPAELIGKRGEGFRYMLILMNNARVGVGFESIGLAESALRGAKEYAAERRSMGKSIDKHEMIAEYFEEMEDDICGVRALGVASCFHEEMAQKIGILEQSGIEAGTLKGQQYLKDLGHHKRQARRMTPLLKFLAAEKAVEIARRGIQIHGGVGYTKDYGAEKLLRDALVLPIYEGTTQIQALMAMKDTLQGIIQNPQGFVKRIAQARWRALSSRDPLEKRLARLQVLSLSTQQHLITKTAVDKFRGLQGKPMNEWPQRFLKNWDPKKDFSYAMLHAERLAQILVDECIAELLYAQASRFPERRPLFERYVERAELRAKYLHEQVTTTGQRLLDRLATTDETEAVA